MDEVATLTTCPRFDEWRIVRMTEPKRLYRSGTNKVIAGVCAGIADYLNVDPTLMRLVAVLAVVFGGSGLLAYIIAWIAIPQEPWPGKHQ